MVVTVQQVEATLEALFVGAEEASCEQARQLRAQVHALRLLAMGSQPYPAEIVGRLTAAYQRVDQLWRAAMAAEVRL